VQQGAPHDSVVFFKSEQEAPRGPAVFKAGEPFEGTHFNINQPDWRNAPAVYLPDPGPGRRDAVAGVLRRPYWMLSPTMTNHAWWRKAPG